ncbi:carotenoid isomerooxygenase-like [Mercenaria mercenaria]|uniref:carotenoid isomerooxygenase-like n=1 Tax=Mercenaria mercenaria TaxID=6596 RepID=UPI00234FAC07|nr:carotenoid isomerooxygenase-like [Mercenaria mercenaria]
MLFQSVEMEHRGKATLLLLLLVFPVTHAYTDAELTEMLKAGLRNVVRETINAPVTVENGSIPQWLSGNFMRHSCGVFGETDNMNKVLPNYVGHLFDCFEIGNKFRIENGQVTFTNRWYDTTVNDIYNFYGREMNDSSYFMSGTFSKVNHKMLDLWSANISDSSKVQDVPHVSWWQIGNEAIAMSETPIGVVVDPNEVAQKGYIHYNDDSFGTSGDQRYSVTNNPAHEQTEPDGTLWSAASVLEFTSHTNMKVKRVVYKVGADRVRHVVGTYHHDDADLTKCMPGKPYPEFGARFGYLHSFAMTENYIILPEVAYMFDPCFYTHYDKYEPFFPQGFKFESTGFTRVLVMRKSDGIFIANITMPPVFVTHQLGAYEDGNYIHMDMLTYNDSSIYDRHTYVDNLLGENHYTTNVTRFTINMADFSARMRNLRGDKTVPAAFEMSNINYAYYGKKYTYAYMVRNFDRREQNALTKLNVDTGVEVEFLLPEGMFVQEPQFIPKPNAKAEDDGVLLAQGVDGRKNKAFMVVVDAKTMSLIGHVTAPDIALLGIHNRFFPLHVGTMQTAPGGPNTVIG